MLSARMIQHIKHRGRTMAAGLMLVTQLALTFCTAVASAAPLPALILYDHNAADGSTKLGQGYANMLANLLSHYNYEAQLVPVELYSARQLEAYEATFYLGSSYDNPLPPSLVQDILQTSKKVIWFKHNLWKLAWEPTGAFGAKYGIAFDGLRGLNSQPTAANSRPGFFDTVLYKNHSMVKYYDFNAGTGAVNADPDIGVTHSIDPAKAQADVLIQNGVTGEQVPYLLHGGNFWYFADIPFSYIGPRDRYLVLCDKLHDILNTQVQESHPALIRLEDVSYLTSPGNIKTLADYLAGRNIPFSIALIPFYRDPLGRYNNGVSQEIHLYDAATAGLRTAIVDATGRGGSIIMHGYTHQINSLINPHSGVSGDDFEFWNIVANTTVPGDSAAFALGRLDAGLNELSRAGLSAFAWEVPHYQASAADYRAFPQRFPVTYQRAVYYTADQPNFSPANGNRDFAMGQFFPFVIPRDIYGQKIIPENLGNIEYDIRNIDPTSTIKYTWQDIVTNADYARVVRDGFASFFFHPFWLESGLGVNGFADFQNAIQGITDLGYVWTDPRSL